jgi:hypothetical protein
MILSRDLTGASSVNITIFHVVRAVDSLRRMALWPQSKHGLGARVRRLRRRHVWHIFLSAEKYLCSTWSRNGGGGGRMTDVR